jgi:hypothetical protein
MPLTLLPVAMHWLPLPPFAGLPTLALGLHVVVCWVFGFVLFVAMFAFQTTSYCIRRPAFSNNIMCYGLYLTTFEILGCKTYVNVPIHSHSTYMHSECTVNMCLLTVLHYSTAEEQFVLAVFFMTFQANIKVFNGNSYFNILNENTELTFYLLPTHNLSWFNIQRENGKNMTKIFSFAKTGSDVAVCKAHA